MQLGMIGLGRMGANMVRRLIKNGHQCVVYCRSKSTVDDLNMVRGQFRGYRQEPGVAADSQIETFAALKRRSIRDAGAACRFTSAPGRTSRSLPRKSLSVC
jgi:6-phosphogluconate dehydrogenase